jgi:hypothetical protein
MALDFFKLLRILLPSLCLLYSFSPRQVPLFLPYHEVFGDEEHYLDLYFEYDPQGYFQKSQHPSAGTFTGYFVTTAGEEKVNGSWETISEGRNYSFRTSQGSFHGKMGKGTKGCEPVLKYRVKEPGGETRSGTLTAGFCL